MKYHILHDFRTSAPFKEKSSGHFEDLHKLKLLENVGINLTSSPRGVANLSLGILFIIPPRNDVRLTSKSVRSFKL